METLKILLVPILIQLSSMGTLYGKDEYHYDNYGLNISKWKIPRSYFFEFDSDFTLIVDPTNEIVKATMCGKKHFCIKSEFFNFSAPKSDLNVNHVWELNKKKFTLKKKALLSLWGKEREVSIIESTEDSGLVNIFFYSSEFGLLGFTQRMKGEMESEVYWLREEYGLGSQKNKSLIAVTV